MPYNRKAFSEDDATETFYFPLSVQVEDEDSEDLYSVRRFEDEIQEAIDDYQEYISAYCLIRDDRYLSAFLHYFEETLHQNALKYMRRHFLMEHFTDMKQAYVAGLLKALKHYEMMQGSKSTVANELG